MILSTLGSLAPAQRNVVLASYLGWSLDAFDFFVLIFVLPDIAKDFSADVTSVTVAITLTLAARPLGALGFGLAADRFGRKPVLMLNILCFSAFGAASAFAPGLGALFVIRTLFGVAMGGEWGIGASLAMESIPPTARGAVSGILQTGYPSGYFLASLAYFLFYPWIGWRGMFLLGAMPALLVLFIRAKISESPSFTVPISQSDTGHLLQILRENFGRFTYAVMLMTGFNFLSHGTQDLYPAFLQLQHHLSSQAVAATAIIYNLGAIIGGLSFGGISERIGRRNAIMAASMSALLLVPVWAFATSPFVLTASAFLMQVAVGGAWGVVPAHLNELSPAKVRGTFPGFAYQTGNLLASANATIQAYVARANSDNYALGLALVTSITAAALIGLAWLGSEAKGVKFSGGQDQR